MLELLGRAVPFGVKQGTCEGREPGDPGYVRLGVLSVGDEDGIELVAVDFRRPFERRAGESDPFSTSRWTFSTKPESLVRRSGSGRIRRERVSQRQNARVEPNIRKKGLGELLEVVEDLVVTAKQPLRKGTLVSCAPQARRALDIDITKLTTEGGNLGPPRYCMSGVGVCRGGRKKKVRWDGSGSAPPAQADHNSRLSAARCRLDSEQAGRRSGLLRAPAIEHSPPGRSSLRMVQHARQTARSSPRSSAPQSRLVRDRLRELVGQRRVRMPRLR